MIKKPLILAVDQSTSATKALVFDASASIVARSSVDHRQYYPRAGWVEHDPEELYANTITAVREAARSLGAEAENVCALALTNQRETAIVWDRSTGKPVYNAVVWQCQRGAELCSRLKSAGHEAQVKTRSGLPLDPGQCSGRAGSRGGRRACFRDGGFVAPVEAHRGPGPCH